MAFNIPNLAALVERARAAFAAQMPGGDAHLWPNNLNPTAKVIGEMTAEVMGYVGYVANQAFITTADWDHLLLHGAEYGLSPRPATAANGTLAVTSTDALTLAPGSVVQRSDGVQFALTAPAATAVAATLIVTVQALTLGAAAITMAGASLSPVAGFSGPGAAGAQCVVTGNGIIGGADVESIEIFRARLLFRKQYPPHGGAPPDYVMWAMSVPGISRVFVERRYLGAGSVRVFVMMDGVYANGIPQAADIAAVQLVMDDNAPSGTLVTVMAPTPMPINVTLTGLAPATNDIEAAVLAELIDAFLRLSKVSGGDTPNAGLPFLATPFTFSESWLWQAAANAANGARVLMLSPAADTIVPAGSIATLGTVIFQ